MTHAQTIEQTPEQRALAFPEFVALMALMMSMTALSTDAMLPALAQIGADLGVVRENGTQLVVSLLFLGMALGQIFYGPWSDSTGRKPAIYGGIGLFGVGCLLSIFALNFPMMLLGRLLQGLGVAGPRGVALALVRDIYRGRTMARVMSVVMTAFILVPIIAPIFGQGILMVSNWRMIFVAYLILAAIVFAWLALRQPETLPPERRSPFRLAPVVRAYREVLSNRIALGYTVMAGLIMGSFLGYLSSAQQIFQELYGLGARFPLVFATLALALGGASLANSRLVMNLGMRTLTRTALFCLAGFSLAFLAIAAVTGGQPPLWGLMVYLLLGFFCVGILFGNLNSMAMEPLGHIAGVGAAVVGSISTLMAVFISTVIGQNYNDTVFPLVLGFATLSILSLLVMWWAEAKGVPVYES